MNRLIRFAIGRWQVTALVATLVVALGLEAFASIPRTEDPQISSPIYFITAVVPGASPSDMEQQVTKPIEEAIGGLDNLRDLASASQNDVVTLRAEFYWGTDPDRRYDEVVREMNALRARLPANLVKLDIDRGRPTAVPFAQVALTSDTLPGDRMEKLARRLKDRLARIPGVRRAQLFGTASPEMRVSLDPQLLAARHVPASAVIDALRADGAESPIGAVHAGERRLVVSSGGAYADTATVRAVPVARRNDAVVRVGDVATVDWAEAETNHLIRFNGRPAALVTVEQLDGQDVRALTSAVDKELSGFERELPGGVKLERGFMQADNLRHRLDQLARDFALALMMVAITLLPLGRRAAAVVMVAIPLSLLIGIAVLQRSGYTLNQLSVAGFILSLGLLVDDAIVVIENIARWLRAGASPAEAAIGATGEIALAVVGCTACLILAFLPLLALPESSGEFIRTLPVAVVGTVIGSLLVALTLIPFIAAHFLKPSDDPHGNRLLRAMTDGIRRFYAPALHAALARPWRAVAWLGGLSLLSLPVIAIIGTSLFPPADLPQFLVEVEMPRGTSLARTDIVVQQVAERLRREPSIRWVSANTGHGNPSLYYNKFPHAVDTATGEVAAAFAEWKPSESPQVLEGLRRDFKRLTGARVSLHIFQQGPPIEAPVAIRIAGPDVDALSALAAEGEKVLRGLPELRDIGNPLTLERTELDLGLDEIRAASLGVPAGAARNSVQLALSGVNAATLRDADGDAYPVTVRLPMAERNDIAALGRIEVPTDTGGTIPLSAIATPTLRSAPAEIDRHNRERTVTLTANVKEGVLTSRASAHAFAALQAALHLPPGYKLVLTGEAETQARSFAGLGPAIAVALLGTMMVLVLEFGRFRTVAVVAAVIPLGLFGAVVALWITGNSLSFTASVGLIALIGIEIKNSILLVDFTEQLRRAGTPVREAVERAGELRFLPVLLTSITAIGGLLPLALERNGLYSPVAVAMIGGLISSTLLARIATPVLYLLLNREEEEA